MKRVKTHCFRTSLLLATLSQYSATATWSSRPAPDGPSQGLSPEVPVLTRPHQPLHPHCSHPQEAPSPRSPSCTFAICFFFSSNNNLPFLIHLGNSHLFGVPCVLHYCIFNVLKWHILMAASPSPLLPPIPLALAICQSF